MLNLKSTQVAIGCLLETCLIMIYVVIDICKNVREKKRNDKKTEDWIWFRLHANMHMNNVF